MKLKLKIDENTIPTTKFTIFMDGKNCGTLTMLSAEAYVFINALSFGADAANLRMETQNV